MLQNLRGVEHVHDHHNQEHHGSIKNVQENLVADNVASVSLRKFDETISGSNHNQQTNSITRKEETVPVSRQDRSPDVHCPLRLLCG